MTTTDRAAVLPAKTVVPTGWVVMAGATGGSVRVTVAGNEVVLPLASVIMAQAWKVWGSVILGGYLRLKVKLAGLGGMLKYKNPKPSPRLPVSPALGTICGIAEPAALAKTHPSLGATTVRITALGVAP